MHVLHAIHDFPPRHAAGSEMYARALARAQASRHHVTVLCADYDLAREHGEVTWRVHDGLPVVEIVNHWRAASFEETYRPPIVLDRIERILDATRPDVVHVHNLLNLSFDLPAAARSRGIPVVATLHDYTLVCPSGGQRVHRAEAHVCHTIDVERCARCFEASPFAAQAGVAGAATGRRARWWMATAARAARLVAPGLAARAVRSAARRAGVRATPQGIAARLDAARGLFHCIDRFVAPSQAIAREFERLGMPSDRIRLSRYGMMPLAPRPVSRPRSPVRFGFVGTLVWHKGVHILIEAARRLPPTAFRLAIFGSLDTFPDYVRELGKLGRGLPIDFAGAFTAAGAADAYAAIDALVVPSIWPENSPLVIQEAFQAGVPVVGARTGGIPELVTDGVNGLLVEPGSVDDLARALTMLVHEPGRIGAMAAAVPPVKTLAQDALEWDAVYAEVIGRRTARRA